MEATSREIVRKCLTFKGPDRIPRHVWHLPWAEIYYPEAVRALHERFPSDFAGADYFYPPAAREKGDPYKKGQYTDAWGCVFENLQDGIIGEVRRPILQDITDCKALEPPYEQLPQSALKKQAMFDRVNRFCENSDKFVFANNNPHPWERYQYVRGTEKALIDILMPQAGMLDMLRSIHEFYLREMELWVKTAVDAIHFMDDWGTQTHFLIAPDLWREWFKPLYKDYCDLAKANGKFVFMHSDGCIQEIYPDFIEIGVDAINSQLFVMDMEYLARIAKGKITFWGEIDRQFVLPSPDPQVGREAVRRVARHFYDPSGGVIAQLEFGAGANPQTVMAVFEEWEKVDREGRGVI